MEKGLLAQDKEKVGSFQKKGLVNSKQRYHEERIEEVDRANELYEEKARTDSQCTNLGEILS